MPPRPDTPSPSSASSSSSSRCPRPSSAEPRPEPAPRPRLVVFVSIDQMRADYLVRFRPLFKAGLKAIAEQGAVFTNARYRHACTETGPGHSVILSGRSPRSSGIVGNTWYDRTLRRARQRRRRRDRPRARRGGTDGLALPLQRLHRRGHAEGALAGLEGRGRLVQGPRGDPDGRQAGRRGVLVRERGRALRDQQLVHERDPALARDLERPAAGGRLRGPHLGPPPPGPGRLRPHRRAGRRQGGVGREGHDLPAPHRQRTARARLLRRPAALAVRGRAPPRLRDRRDEGARPGSGRGHGHAGRRLLGLRQHRPHLRPRQPGADGQLRAPRPARSAGCSTRRSGARARAASSWC